MNVGTISMRYAEALYRYAGEHNAQDAVYKDMQHLKALLRNVKELPVILKSPSMTAAEKVRFLCDAIEDVSPVFRRFAAFVIKASREEMLLYMAYSYIHIYREEKKVIAIKVTTATALSAALQRKIEQLVLTNGASAVEIKNVVDSSIIGGFICEANNTRLDASIGNQLAEIKKKIVKTNKKLV